MKNSIMAFAIMTAFVGHAEDFKSMKSSLPSEAHIRVLMGSENVILSKAEASDLRLKMTLLLAKLEGAELINQYFADEDLENVNAMIGDVIQTYPTHVGGDGTTVKELSSKAFAVISATPTIVAMLMADKAISWMPMVGATRYSIKGTDSRPVKWHDPRTWGNMFSKKDKAFYAAKVHRRAGSSVGYALRGTVGMVGVMVVIDEINSTESLIVLAEDERAALEKEVKSIISQLDQVLF